MRINRNFDKQKEVRLMPVFDKFYNQTIVRDGFSFERNYATDLQIKGIDVVFKDLSKDLEYLIDEKCAVHFYHRDNQLKTYSFELYSLSNKNTDGWFCNNDFYLTTHYNLFYPIADNKNLDNIEQLDMILVEKKKIWDFINKIGFNDKDEILNYFFKHREKNTERDYCFINNSVKVVQSKTFREKPINIIIKREELENLACKTYSLKFERGEQNA